jgi:hypothetical protein
MSETLDRRIAFNAGEISPWLDPRIDMEKYRMACRTLQNMRGTIYGGAVRRSGTEYKGATLSSTSQSRLVAFSVNSTTQYIVEFSNLKLRVWETVTGAIVADNIDSPFLESEINAMQFVQQNDVMFIAHPSRPPMALARYSNTSFMLTTLDQSWPVLLDENFTSTTITAVSDTALTDASIPTYSSSTAYVVGNSVKISGRYFSCIKDTTSAWAFITAPLTGSSWTTYWKESALTSLVSGWIGAGAMVTLTPSSTIFDASHVGTKWIITQRRNTLVEKLTLNGAVAGAVGNPIYVLGEWSVLVRATTSGSGEWSCYVIVQKSVDLINWDTHVPVKSGTGDVQQLLTGTADEPCFIRLKLVSFSGTLPTGFVAELEVSNPDHQGMVQIRSVSGTTARAVVITPMLNGTATTRWQAPAWNAVNGYPRAISLHNGRLWFGGTTAKPTTLWASTVDSYGDFRIGAEADRASAYTLQSDEASAVEWLISQELLIIGTSSGEWVFGQKLGEDVAKIRRNTSFGSSAIQARAINDAVVFIQRSKRKLREYAYAADKDGYNAVDLNMLAEHLGDAGFKQMAIQRNPEAVVWVVTERGDLLALTYERGQSVAGWSRHVTDGSFESVAVVLGSGEDDQVWVTVKRTINGATKRYVERFQPDTLRKLKDGNHSEAIYLDSAKQVAPAGKVCTGLSHLEGKTVSILADGMVHRDLVVSGGSLSLDVASTSAIIGLPFESILEPTYLETMDPNSNSKLGKKRLTRAMLEFWKTLGGELSTDGGTTWNSLQIREEGSFLDQESTPFSGLMEEYVESSSDRQVTVAIRQKQPLPLNIMSMGLRYRLEA